MCSKKINSGIKPIHHLNSVEEPHTVDQRWATTHFELVAAVSAAESPVMYGKTRTWLKIGSPKGKDARD